MIPQLSTFNDIVVVCDDLFEGGTKARFIPRFFDMADEVVYASPAEGGAQTALAFVAKRLGKQATIFVASRQQLHARTLLAQRLGAKIVQISPGYLSNVQAKAKSYCERTGAFLAPFGMDCRFAIDAIARAALSIDFMPTEVWCAAGSGVLMRGLSTAWPSAKRFAVQIGRDVSAREVAGATIIKHPLRFGDCAKSRPPFPSDPHYDAKAWEICSQRASKGALFWNVTGPA